MGLAVVLLNILFIKMFVRKKAHQFCDSRLHEMNTCRLQRLHKSACQSQSHTIFIPESFSLSGSEAQLTRLSQRFSIEILHKNGPCFVIIHKSAAINMAITNTMLQRNTPLPTCLMRN